MRLKSLMISLTVLLALALAPAGALAATYYVDAASGSDTATGASASAAFKTIQRAADVMVGGDTCRVQPGAYGKTIVTRSGSSGKPITFQADGKVVCQGFWIKGANDITVRGFEITGVTISGWSSESKSMGAGVSIQGLRNTVENNNIHNMPGYGVNLYASARDGAETADCVIRGNKISYCGTVGIYVEGQRHLVENNDISHTLQYPPNYLNVSSAVDADGIRFFGTKHVIRGNYIHDILHAPENLSDPHIDCFQTWETAYDILFEKNTCMNPNTTGSNQMLMLERKRGAVRDLTFRNNLFMMYDSGYHPMNFKGVSTDSPVISGMVVVNNTFANLGGGGQYAIRMRQIQNAVVENNLFYNFNDAYNQPVRLEEGSTASVKGNAAHNTKNAYPSGGLLSGVIRVDAPKLSNPAGRDFTLLAGSPLVDAGVSIASILDDHDSTPRPQGGGFDIGAFERKTTVETAPLPPTNIQVQVQ